MGDEMTRFFGRQLEVKDRVDRIIDERTGEMREIRDTVTLQDDPKRVDDGPSSDVSAPVNWATARETNSCTGARSGSTGRTATPASPLLPRPRRP